MFKNNVFKVSVNTQKWVKATAIRTVRTMAQVAVATIGVAVGMGEVNWLAVGSATLLAGVLTILTALTGLPEVESKG